MIVKLLLDRKRAGEELAPGEIRELVDAYTRGDVPDYQMAAFAMAVCCRGMSPRETLALTESMRDSGTCLDWSGLGRPTADKHSTGGVGDKLSLVVQPLAAACGLGVPSLTGRGLGLTGGTADKMESIPGYVAGLSLADYRRVVSDCGCSLTVQTAEIAPADKKLYGLRDVTGTVPSIPLIVASILSKKLAEGAGTLVFDVKSGSGAFMKTRNDAVALAEALVTGAKGAGRKACALVTDMSQPLGFAVGNANEVQEALDVLRGDVRLRDIVGLSIELAARMVALGLEIPVDEARARCRANLANGAALDRFARMVILHGGDLAAFERNLADFRRNGPAQEIRAPRDGWIARIDAAGVAQAAFELGAGRAKSSDTVDPYAGVDLRIAAGDRVEKGATLARVASGTHPETLSAAAARVAAAVTFSDEPPPARAHVLKEIA